MAEKGPLVVIAACTRTDLIPPDDAPLAGAFERAGARVWRHAWDDAGVDWSRFDLCAVRSTWDYYRKVERFGVWLGHVASCCPVVNPTALMRWNVNKAYLLELSLAGVSVIPTRLGRAEDLEGVIESIRPRSPAGVVLKPAVGAGAEGLSLLAAGERLSPERRAAALGPTGTALVQPMLESIRTAGETSLVWIDGAWSHAVRKVPTRGDIRVQTEWGGVYTVVEPTAAQRRVGEMAISAAAAASGAAPVYARVDLADLDDGAPALMELEVIEPELFFGHVPGAADRLARAMLARLR